MKRVLLFALSLTICAFVSQYTFAQHQVSKLWQTDSVLKVPESVLYDGAHKLLYFSNIDGDPSTKDGKGSIGKMGVDGKIIKIDWVSGLDAPKGLGLYKGNLYVSDVDNIVIIDVAKGAIVKKIPIDGAKFLNDVTVDANGVVYIADSQTGKVHMLKNGAVSVFHEGFKRPNGLLAVAGELYVLASGELFKLDKTGKSMTKIAEGMDASTDGIEQVKDGEFVVSSWSGVIYYVKKDGSKEQLLDTRAEKSNTADIGYDPQHKIIYVPTFMKKSVAAYQLK